MSKRLARKSVSLYTRMANPLLRFQMNQEYPRAQFMTWIKLYQTTVTPTGTIATQREFVVIKKRFKKLENMVGVLQIVNCTVSSPL